MNSFIPCMTCKIKMNISATIVNICVIITINNNRNTIKYHMIALTCCVDLLR